VKSWFHYVFSIVWIALKLLNLVKTFKNKLTSKLRREINAQGFSEVFVKKFLIEVDGG
jgi:hypothetical protein